MNELVKQLYIQAAQEHREYKAPQHGPIDESTMNRILELVFDSGCGYRFAELIVQECAAKAWWAEQYNLGDGVPISKQIEKHFGVR